MKKLLIVCIIGLLLTGCSKGVSQEEYDSLQSEYTALLEKTNIVSLIEKADTENMLISKWGRTMFDDAVSYIIDDDKAGLVTTLDKTEDINIEIFVSMILINQQTLTLFMDDESYSQIYITALDTAGMPVVVAYLDLSDLSNIKTEFIASDNYIDIVSESVKSTISNIN